MALFRMLCINFQNSIPSLKKLMVRLIWAQYVVMLGICGVYLHFSPMKGPHVGKQCFHDYHDDGFFGLARCDVAIFNAKKSEWMKPTVAKEKANSKMTAKICKEADM